MGSGEVPALLLEKGLGAQMSEASQGQGSGVFAHDLGSISVEKS